MTIWHWVRHGPTHAKTFVGWRDVPADLSDQPALDRLNAILPQQATVVSSDLSRAISTADAVTGRRRLPHMPLLREFHFGAWDGQHFSEIADAYPEESRAYWETPGEIAPPGGESWTMAAARVETAVTHIEARCTGPIIAVAHIGVILTQVQRVLKISPVEALAYKIDNLSVTTLDRATGEAEINRIP